MKAVLDHVGIAVRDLPAALAFYRDALGLDVEAPEEVVSQRVRAHFLPVGESALELLEATAPDSPIAKYVDKRGPGLHHITLRVEDIDEALASLKTRGVKLIDEQPRPGAEGSLVAFIHPSAAHGVLVELKQASRTNPLSEVCATRFTLGDLELISLHDGFLRFDGGAMYGVTPRRVWEKDTPADEQNRVTMAMRPLVVRGVRIMLIDTGLGANDHGTIADQFAPERARNLDHTLAEAGLTPESIDIVLATHLHFEHAGGFFTRDVNGQLRPRFPRARYVVRRGEWEDANNPHERNRWGYVAENFRPLVAAGVLELVDDDQTIMPGVRVERSGGHTMHHQVIRIESGGQKALYLADLIPTTAHLTLSWIPALDLYPMDSLGAKKALLQEAEAAHTLLLFDHDPVVAAAHIERRDGVDHVVTATGELQKAR